MRKKYNYFVDNVQVKRCEFFAQLKKYSYRDRLVDVINGWCGVSVREFDEEKYKERMRDINNGYIVLVMDGNVSKAFKRIIA